MEVVNKVSEFVMGPYGVMLVSVLLLIISEYMGINPNLKANGILDFVVKALQSLKKAQDAKKNGVA